MNLFSYFWKIYFCMNGLYIIPHTSGGSSALSMAAERGDVDVMKVLIEGGADVIIILKKLP